MATSSLIDVMRCALVCLGAAFSEGGEFLATCHEKQRAVYIWANKNIFISNFFIQPNISVSINSEIQKINGVDSIDI